MKGLRKMNRSKLHHGVETIYSRAKVAGLEMDTHEGDLYLKDTPEAREVIKADGRKVDGWHISIFRSAIDGTPWLDVAFGNEPFFKPGTPFINPDYTPENKGCNR